MLIFQNYSYSACFGYINLNTNDDLYFVFNAAFSNRYSPTRIKYGKEKKKI